MRIREITEAKPKGPTLGDVATYTGGGGLGQALAAANSQVNFPDKDYGGGSSGLDSALGGTGGFGGTSGGTTGGATGGATGGGSVGNTNPSSIPRGAGGSGNAKAALNFFIGKGLTPAQAAGIVGNLQAESGMGINPGAVGDGGKAIGIAQWHPDRRANFERAFKKPFGQSTFQDQLNFIWWELNNTERNAMNKLRSARSAEQAAAIFDQYYERSSGAHRNKRMRLATALLTPSTTG